MSSRGVWQGWREDDRFVADEAGGGAWALLFCAKGRGRIERVADRHRAAQPEPAQRGQHVADETLPGETGRGRRRSVPAQIEGAARQARGETSRQGAEAEAVQCGAVDRRGRLPAATEVMGGEHDAVGARAGNW
jgi:hypothetical protein